MARKKLKRHLQQCSKKHRNTGTKLTGINPVWLSYFNIEDDGAKPVDVGKFKKVFCDEAKKNKLRYPSKREAHEAVNRAAKARRHRRVVVREYLCESCSEKYGITYHTTTQKYAQNEIDQSKDLHRSYVKYQKNTDQLSKKLTLEEYYFILTE